MLTMKKLEYQRERDEAISKLVDLCNQKKVDCFTNRNANNYRTIQVQSTWLNDTQILTALGTEWKGTYFTPDNVVLYQEVPNATPQMQESKAVSEFESYQQNIKKQEEETFDKQWAVRVDPANNIYQKISYVDTRYKSIFKRFLAVIAKTLYNDKCTFENLLDKPYQLIKDIERKQTEMNPTNLLKLVTYNFVNIHMIINYFGIPEKRRARIRYMYWYTMDYIRKYFGLQVNSETFKYPSEENKIYAIDNIITPQNDANEKQYVAYIPNQPDMKYNILRNILASVINTTFGMIKSGSNTDYEKQKMWNEMDYLDNLFTFIGPWRFTSVAPTKNHILLAWNVFHISVLCRISENTSCVKDGMVYKKLRTCFGEVAHWTGFFLKILTKNYTFKMIEEES